ncbi:basic proline-rich protein-like [Manis pentadactyla]|uniref:basic proline-rich protein-like n=1 Tax=Manis pentadactyla TaxID=143292 RepID=UPI00255CAC59|nr:basic proline-rich protein-like [Manis pentadactyla]
MSARRHGAGPPPTNGKALPPGGLSPAAPPPVTPELQPPGPRPRGPRRENPNTTKRPPGPPHLRGHVSGGGGRSAARPRAGRTRAAGRGPAALTTRAGTEEQRLRRAPPALPWRTSPAARTSAPGAPAPLLPFPGGPSGGARLLQAPGRAPRAHHPRRPLPGPTGHALPAEQLARPPPCPVSPCPQAEALVPPRPAATYLPARRAVAVVFSPEAGPALDPPPQIRGRGSRFSAEVSEVWPGQRLQVRAVRRPPPVAGEPRRGECGAGSPTGARRRSDAGGRDREEGAAKHRAGPELRGPIIWSPSGRHADGTAARSTESAAAAGVPAALKMLLTVE